MANEIIITYETRYNATREIAQKIGEVPVSYTHLRAHET